MILDYCKHRQGQRGADTALPYAMPIVVDAEDIIYNTEPTMQKLCSLIGIDSAGVQYSWDPMPEEKLSEQLLDGWFFRDLFKSTGVQMRTNKVCLRLEPLCSPRFVPVTDTLILPAR